MMKSILLTAILGLSLGATAARADEAKQPAKDKPAQEETAKAKPYPMTTCFISGEEFDEDDGPEVIVYKGQELKFCCKKCLKKFKSDPDKSMKKFEEAKAKEAAKAKKAGEPKQ
jgi:YHS domain-containing protein